MNPAAMVWRAVRNFGRDNCLDLAATVSFYSLLALGPLAYLLGVALGRLFGQDQALERTIERLSMFLPPEAAAAVGPLIPDLVGGGGLVLIALPVLLWVASTSFSSLEDAINVAFGRSAGTRFWRSRLKGFAVLLVGFAVIGVSLLLEALAAGLGGRRSLGLLLLLTYLTFCLFYKLLPHGRVSWTAASSGAGLALLLWEAARRLFGGFLLRSPSFGLLNGAVAGLVALLLWIYTAVAIVLLGAELAAVLNGRRGETSSRGRA